MKESTRIFMEKRYAENAARMAREAKGDYGQPIHIVGESTPETRRNYERFFRCSEEIKPLTATEIKKGNEDCFNNPSPELQRVYDSFGRLQERIFAPLIKRARQLLREKRNN